MVVDPLPLSGELDVVGEAGMGLSCGVVLAAGGDKSFSSAFCTLIVTGCWTPAGLLVNVIAALQALLTVGSAGGFGAARFLRDDDPAEPVVADSVVVMDDVGVLRPLPHGLGPMEPYSDADDTAAPTIRDEDIGWWWDVGGNGARFLWRRVYALRALAVLANDDAEPYSCELRCSGESPTNSG